MFENSILCILMWSLHFCSLEICLKYFRRLCVKSWMITTLLMCAEVHNVFYICVYVCIHMGIYIYICVYTHRCIHIFIGICVCILHTCSTTFNSVSFYREWQFTQPFSPCSWSFSTSLIHAIICSALCIHHLTQRLLSWRAQCLVEHCW